MASMVSPLIAIVGALDDTRPELELRDIKGAVVAAAELGRALAEQGCRLLVYSSDPGFLESHVVRGFISSAAAGPDSIVVVYPHGQPAPVFEQQQKKPICFKFKVSQHASWEVSFYQSLEAADGVILMGGGQSTFVSGILAVTRQMPLAAIESHGGMASKVWELIEPGAGSVILEEKELMATDSGSDKWPTKIVASLLAQRRRQQERELQRATQSRAYRWQVRAESAGAVVMLACALAIAILSWDTPMSRVMLLTALVLTPAIAGTSASLMRILQERSIGAADRSRQVGLTVTMGCVAGTVAGLLYVLAQLTAFSPTAQGALPVIAGRLVPFSLLTGFLAGATGDAFFKRMIDRPVGPIELSAAPRPS
jgi:hypothetical protein